MITMLLGGLWHGAGWTFVLWGLLHGGGRPPA
jgi:alginate O-acetyltransferase complex protein AlgI